MKQLIIGVNKTDSTKRQEEMVKEINTESRTLWNNPDIVAFVSISGWNVDSILETSANMPWFKR